MIRAKNLDLTTEMMRRYDNVSLGDITATRSYIVFTAPFACILDRVDLYSNEANPPQANTASVTNFSATLANVVNGTAVTMTTRGTSATATPSDSISANVRWALTPTANNSLTVGTQVRLACTVGGSGTLSAVLCQVQYTPQKHRESR